MNFIYWFLSFFGFSEYERLGGMSRSPLWSQILKAFAVFVPKRCMICGTSLFVQLHHSEDSFAANPTRECDPTQLRWLCRIHHLWYGHNGDFRSINFRLQEQYDLINVRPYFILNSWIPSQRKTVKYKLTQKDLDAWNVRFGTEWVYNRKVETTS